MANNTDDQVLQSIFVSSELIEQTVNRRLVAQFQPPSDRIG